MSLYRPRPRKGYRSPFWYYDFQVRGVRYTGSTGEKNKIDARQKESEKRKEAKAGNSAVQIKPITFSDFAREYLRIHAEAKRSASFYDFTVRILKRRFGDKLLASIMPLDCASFVADRRKDVKPATANASLVVLKHMLKMAEEWGYLLEGTNPARKLKREKVRNSRDRYLDRDEAGSVLAACLDWLRPIVMTALHTGGSRGELLGLTWEDIDFNVGTVCYRDTKNGDARKVSMSPTLQSALRSLPGRLKGGKVFVRGDQPVTNDVLRWAFDSTVKKAGLTDFRFHDLRHTWATHLAMDGLPLRTLQELGGWRRPEMVQRYAAVTPASKEAAAASIERVFGASPATSPQQAPRNYLKDRQEAAGAEDRT